MCILWYCGSLEGLLAAFRSLEGLLGALGERLGDVLEALEGLLEASWKPLGGLLRASGSWETAWKPFLRVLRVFTTNSSFSEHLQNRKPAYHLHDNWKTWLSWNGKRVRLESCKYCKRRFTSIKVEVRTIIDNHWKSKKRFGRHLIGNREHQNLNPRRRLTRALRALAGGLR